MKKVLFTECSFSDKEIEKLRRNELEIVKAPGDLDEEELIKKLQGCWGYICGGSEKATENVIKNTKLQLIIFYGTGYENHINVRTATANNIVVANTPKANAYTVAEYTVAHILNAVKRITDSNNKTKNGEWDRNRSWLLKDKTLGIIGLGTIGTHVARIMKNAFNMNILYAGRNRKLDAEKEFGAKAVKVAWLMKKSDVVTIHVPCTKETENMIGAKELSLMRPSAVLVNCARAELVDGKALYESLKSGKLALASFDGYYKEPAPKKSDDKWGLLSLPDDKFIITPHTGYNTKEAFDAMNNMVIENLLAFIETKEVPYRVN